MKGWSREELKENIPSWMKYLNYHNEREARPRLACSDCQFEYVVEDGHECDTRQGAKEVQGESQGRQGS